MKKLDLLSVLGGAVLCAIAAPTFAQSLCPETSNTCMADVNGPHQGRHSALDGSADAVLWPPNHKFRTISIAASNSCGDNCDVTITDVTQDEPLTGLGSGNFSPDAANCQNGGDVSYVDLRGERAGSAGDSESGAGDGRYYHVNYKMHDPDFPAMDAMGVALVLVPHDQGNAHIGTWVDEGPLFGSDGTTDGSISCSN